MRTALCFLDFGFGPYHQPHSISAIGFDDVHAVIIGHDGLKPNSLIGHDKFNKAWTRASRWMLVIEPKSGETKHEP